MSGMVIRAAGITPFNFNDVESAGTGFQYSAMHIDVSQFRFATLIVRVHSGSIPSGGSLAVVALTDGQTMEDPAVVFLQDPSSPAGSVSFAAQGGASSAPLFNTGVIDPDEMGSMISLLVLGTQSSPGGSFEGTLSIDVALKD